MKSKVTAQVVLSTIAAVLALASTVATAGGAYASQPGVAHIAATAVRSGAIPSD